MILSIIIPTKNRYNTLFSIVDTILKFDKNDDIEIVIQDNSDNNLRALSFIKERGDFVNLKYFHESSKLSVIENSDKAVLNSNGEYICFIGDDDGVMPYIVDVCNWMKREELGAIKSYKPNYYWPGQKSNFLSVNVSGILKFDKFDYNIREIKTKNALQKTLACGGTSMKSLPCLYHGIIKKEILNNIFLVAGTYFPGPSPDMANAIAMTQVLENYVYLDFPVVISGKSSKSTGGQGVLHKHISRIEDVAHLPKNTAKEWDYRVPKYWTGPTIWAESVLKSLKNMGNNEEIKKMNFSYLYASLYVFHSEYKKEIFKDFPFKTNSYKFFLAYIKIIFKRSYIFLKNRVSFSSIESEDNLASIGQAIEKLNANVKFEKMPFYE